MKLARSFVAIMAIAALAACDEEEDPTDPNGGGDAIVVADLAGAYQIGSFTYDVDDSDDVLNLTQIGMGVTQLTVQSSGAFTGTLRFPDPATGTPTDYPIGGTIVLANATASNADLTINFDAATQALGILDASESGTVSLSGDDLTLTLTEVTVPDGTGPLAGLEADLIMVATRS